MIYILRFIIGYNNESWVWVYWKFLVENIIGRFREILFVCFFFGFGLVFFGFLLLEVNLVKVECKNKVKVERLEYR